MSHLAEAATVSETDNGPQVHRTKMPFEMDAGLGEKARIGLIVLSSDYTIEHEFRQILNIPGVAFYESRIPNSPDVNPATLAAMAADLTACTDVIAPGVPLDVVAYGCTSGAMVIGPDKVAERIHAARPGVAWATPMTATTAALQALGAKRVCFIAPYLEELNRSMRSYLLDAGFEVPVQGSWNEPNDNNVARISPASIRRAVVDLGGDDKTDAVFLACTSLRLAEQAAALEAEIGKPVISSNTAIAWHCLRLAGYNDPVPGYGSLFETALA